MLQARRLLSPVAALPPEPLYFFRHGETFFNAEGRIQGQLDTPLSPHGRDQAGEAGAALVGALRADGFDPSTPAYFASPLSRATETMGLARRAMGLPVEDFTTDPLLMELSFGRWQNQTWPEIRARDPGEVAARQKDVWSFTPPGGESYAALTQRVGEWLAGLSGPAVAAAHGGVARALMVLLGGLSPSDAVSMPIHQGRILVFSGGKGRWIDARSPAVQAQGGIGPPGDLC